MLTLKNSPGTLLNWLNSEYPNIDPTLVCFIEGTDRINQDKLNPYASQVIILYRKDLINQRVYVLGCILYGTENLVGLEVLSMLRVQHLSPKEVSIVPPSEPPPTLESVKAHINGTYFSLETLKIILAIAPHSSIAKREMRKDLVPVYLCTFVNHVELLDDEELTIEDYQRSWRRETKGILNLRTFPLIFNVPINEYIPGTAHKLYIGGFFHIPLPEMNAWIWRRLLAVAATIKTSEIPHCKEIVEHLEAEKKKRRKHISVLVSSEEIDKHLPPCMRHILYDSKKFPKDEQRQQVVRVLSNAGIPLEYVKERLGNLNKQQEVLYFWMKLVI